MAKSNKATVEGENALDSYNLDEARVIRRLIRGDGSIELTLGFPAPNAETIVEPEIVEPDEVILADEPDEIEPE